MFDRLPRPILIDKILKINFQIVEPTSEVFAKYGISNSTIQPEFTTASEVKTICDNKTIYNEESDCAEQSLLVNCPDEK